MKLQVLFRFYFGFRKSFNNNNNKNLGHADLRPLRKRNVREIQTLLDEVDGLRQVIFSLFIFFFPVLV